MRKGSPFWWSEIIIPSYSMLIIGPYVSPKIQQPTYTLNSKQKQKRQKKKKKAPNLNIKRAPNLEKTLREDSVQKEVISLHFLPEQSFCTLIFASPIRCFIIPPTQRAVLLWDAVEASGLPWCVSVNGTSGKRGSFLRVGKKKRKTTRPLPQGS